MQQSGEMAFQQKSAEWPRTFLYGIPYALFPAFVLDKTQSVGLRIQCTLLELSQLELNYKFITVQRPEF